MLVVAAIIFILFGFLFSPLRTSRFLGRYVFIIGENEKNSKVYVGKDIFKKTELGSKLTIGEINRKLINIRPGICKNNDK